MSSAAVGTHSGAGPLSLMSCVRESSPLQDFDSDSEKNVASKRKFWNPKKWFRRKNKVTEDVVSVEVTEIGKDALRSRSTSELSVAEESRRRSSSSMHPGLSVSHDSVFHSPNSGSDMELDAAQSSSSLSISQPLVDLRLQTELSERLRLRRGRGDTSEDDEGLPHSPCNSPTTSDGLLLDKTAIKDLPTKSHSTCSDGSLHSMGSYEMDEDSFGPHSRHSSKLSLHEKKSNPDSDFEFGPSSTVEPLNHSAAHHRVSVRPKRTHGAPRRKRGQQLSSALPVTPEVNEESSIRSISPENNRKETITALYSMSTTRTLTETQLKCSSLPPGLAAPGSESGKLNRSKSNAGSKSQDHFSPLQEDAEKEEKPSLLERIFPRKSGRKKKSKEEREASSKHETKVTKEESAFKHEEISREERVVNVASVTSSVTKSYAENSTVATSTSIRHEGPKPIAAPRTGAAARQRMMPIDIPATPDEVRREANIILPKQSPEKSLAGTSPLQAELENRFKQRQISLSTSPPKSTPRAPDTPPESPPKSPRSPILPSVISSKTEFSQYTRASSTTTKQIEVRTRSDDIRNKLKIPGLSSLQQRVLSLNDDETDVGFKSLTDFTSESVKPSKPITKSHSFKSTKHTFDAENRGVCVKPELTLGDRKEDNRISFTKAASLDSIKNLEEQTHPSEYKFQLKATASDTAKVVRDKVDSKTDNNTDKSKNDGLSNLEVFRDSITISGPSHTAVVNVTSNSEDFTTSTAKTTSSSSESAVIEKNGSKVVSVKENQISVTKIQLKRETTQVTQSTISLPKSSVPEFLNKQLNKVEVRPSSNIIFSMKSPRITDEQNRPKTLFNFEPESEVTTKPPTPRKFSKENLEIIERDDKEETEVSPKTPPVTSPTSGIPQPARFKKNDTKNGNRKPSVTSVTPESPGKEKLLFKSKSESLDSLKSDINESDQSSQDSLDKLEEKPKEKTSPVSETVVLRRKSLANKKNDEEPELMKVFARRSLKLKDSDVESIQDNLTDSKTRDSDKENQMDSPVDDRKKWHSKPKESLSETEFPQRRKSLGKQETVDPKSPTKDPLIETKIPDTTRNNKDSLAESPVALRKTINNNIFISQRTVSLNPPKNTASDLLVKKQPSFTERRKTDQWMIKNEDTELKEKIQDEIITSDFITEPKNFNQRKAEWEKRAQQAQKKTTP